MLIDEGGGNLFSFDSLSCIPPLSFPHSFSHPNYPDTSVLVLAACHVFDAHSVTIGGKAGVGRV